MLDLALVTCLKLPEPDPDAEPLTRALGDAGLSVQWIAWDHPDDLPDARLTVIRSTWNYVHRIDAFLAWIDRIDQLINPSPLVHWNHHKSYLRDLETLGIAVVPTVLVRRGDDRSLASHLAAKGWDRAVAKPAVSAGSFETRRADRSGQNDLWFREVVSERDMLIQPYVASVEAYGERSLVWIDGEVTHAVRKNPRLSGAEEQVSETSVPVADDERAFADRVVETASRRAGARPLYARVDLVRDERGEPTLMELELIEPSLFFTQGPEGLARFVAALSARVIR